MISISNFLVQITMTVTRLFHAAIAQQKVVKQMLDCTKMKMTGLHSLAGLVLVVSTSPFAMPPMWSEKLVSSGLDR